MKSSKQKQSKSGSDDCFANDNTQKLLGFDYQKLIALEYCLNAKKNEHIWIECKGDVADKETSIEVKHHNKAHSLISNSIDVWKTLKNYLVEHQIIAQFDYLVLHTTSTIPDYSIFYGWNDLSSEKKKSKLLSHKPSDSIKVFHEVVKNSPEKKLLDILSKFSILDGQPTVDEKWNELKEHPAFTIIPDDFRDAAIEKLYGYITKAAIDDSKKWQINITDFKKDMQHTLSPFTSGKIPFPVIQKSDISSSNSDFLFIKKMQDVRLKETTQENAISDYLRANMSQFKLLSMSPTLEDILKTYDANIERMLGDEKECIANELLAEDIGTATSVSKSNQLYYNCINKAHEQITNVDSTQKYYRDGRIHHVLEETESKWEFKEEDV